MSQVRATWGESLGQGFDQAMQSIVEGRKQYDAKQMQKLMMSQTMGGFDPEEILRGQKLAAQGFVPQMYADQAPMPSQAANQFMAPQQAPSPYGQPGGLQGPPQMPLNAPQMPQFQQNPMGMGSGANLPLNPRLSQPQNPSDVRAYGVMQDWQNFNQLKKSNEQKLQQINMAEKLSLMGRHQSENSRDAMQNEKDRWVMEKGNQIDPVTGLPMPSLKEKAQDEKTGIQLMRLTNPATSFRGLLLGTAGMGNMRADRALKILSKPTASSQELSAAAIDFAGMIQGGVPSEIEFNKQNYNTIQGKWADLKTYLTGHPQDAGTPAIQQKIRDMVSEVKEVDNLLIGRNMQAVEAMNAEWVSRNQKKWDNYKSKVLGMGEYDQNASKGIGVVQSQTDYNKLPSGSQYVGQDGKTYRKK